MAEICAAAGQLQLTPRPPTPQSTRSETTPPPPPPAAASSAPPIAPSPSACAVHPAESETSLDTTAPRRSHQAYLDSLEPPDEKEYLRLARLQEQRRQEHRRRDQELQHQHLTTARESMEARRDFMQARAEQDEAAEGMDAEQKPRSPDETGREDQGEDRAHPKSRHSGRAPAGTEPKHEPLRSKAATVIQRSYRGYRVRREMQGLGLDANTRWTHAIRDVRWKELNTPRARGDSLLPPEADEPDGEPRSSTSRSNARRNWMKVATIARRAGADEDSDHSDTASSGPDEHEMRKMTTKERERAKEERREAQAKRRKHAQMMGLQYFLEMVDLKHRYGSNLRTYHEEWKKTDTNENFFYWLDYGEGKDVEVASCPRERLEREQVRYLSREERQYYLVKVDAEGRLVWAKNGARIDTTEEWKDSIHGIVPADDPTPAFAPAIETHMRAKSRADEPPEPHDHHDGLDSSSASSRESELEEAAAAKYANPGLDNAKGARKVRHVSAATVMNKLLRKSVRKNTWIFVADTAFRLYVGIKNSGAFQHSSFLQGARISAAGLIKVKAGRLSSLSPLSGHYRPPASNFRAFVHSLEREGVDMGHVSISRSYAVLVGLEAYVKTRRKGRQAAARLAHKRLEVLAPERARRAAEAAQDTSRSAAVEREVVAREEEARREENRASVRLLRALGIRPRVPKGQKDGSASTSGPGPA